MDSSLFALPDTFIFLRLFTNRSKNTQIEMQILTDFRQRTVKFLPTGWTVKVLSEIQDYLKNPATSLKIENEASFCQVVSDIPWETGRLNV